MNATWRVFVELAGEAIEAGDTELAHMYLAEAEATWERSPCRRAFADGHTEQACEDRPSFHPLT